MTWQSWQLVRDANRTCVRHERNDYHLAPRTFDDKQRGVYVPRWGSVALLKLAVQAQAVDLEPVRVSLRDVSMLPLPSETADDANEAIVAALRASDLQAAQGLLDGPGGPYVVLSVELESLDGARVVVERFGGFEATEDEPIPALLRAAESILSIS